MPHVLTKEDPLLAKSPVCFLFAHPDDEIYVCALLRQLVLATKEVSVIYATAGDAKGLGDIRRGELVRSMKEIGVENSNIHILEIPEKEVVSSIENIVTSSLSVLINDPPQVMVGHAYEGGHEAHDILHYCAAELVRIKEIPHFYTFPLYHGKPQERKAACFLPGKEAHLQFPLDEKDSQLKDKILDIHQSQTGHFEGLKRSSPGYMDRLKSVERYWLMNDPYDYREKPCEEVGYTFHRNGFRFEDFRSAVLAYEKNRQAY